MTPKDSFNHDQSGTRICRLWERKEYDFAYDTQVSFPLLPQ